MDTDTGAYLDASHRCDACGARAWVWVSLPKAKSELLFCGHHYRAYEKALTEREAFVVDERHLILACG